MLRLYSSLLAKALVVAEVSRAGKIAPATLSAITAGAAAGGGPVTALVAGSPSMVSAAAAVLSTTKGVAEVLTVEGEHYGDSLAEEFAPLVDAIVKEKGVTHVLAGCTAFGKDLIPLAAARQKAMPITDITQVKAETVFVRPMYAGNVMATLESKSPLHYITVRGTAFERAASGSAAACPVVALPPRPPVGRTTFVGITEAKADAPDLTTAPVVVAGGRGLKNKENFAKLFPLAKKLKAAVGATRAAVDSGFTANEDQIGQTGKNVAPGLYMAFGISGAIQHIAGMRDSKVVVAVNTDEEAPIFQHADYALVGDATAVVEELTKKL